MSYAVKEILLTIQGEGANSGLPAVFCRFTGCNLWSGREEDRHAARCRFCDTDFRGTDGPGGGIFPNADDLAFAIHKCWHQRDGGLAGEMDRFRFVVLTGGEPALQADSVLVDALHERHFRVAMETNGTVQPPAGLDWICVSPKAGNPLTVTEGNELKLVFPQEGLEPRDLEDMTFEHFLLQPMDGPERVQNTALAVEYCRRNPRWRLSLQTHKYIGIP